MAMVSLDLPFEKPCHSQMQARDLDKDTVHSWHEHPTGQYIGMCLRPVLKIRDLPIEKEARKLTFVQKSITRSNMFSQLTSQS